MTIRKSLLAAIGLISSVVVLTVSPALAQSNAPKRHAHHTHKHVHHAKVSAAPAAEKPAS
jgi:hypothetical protein